MREALEEAKIAASLGEAPIGAVIVQDGRIVGRGHNTTETDKDPTCHAEMNAIRQAAKNLGYRAHCGIGHCKDAFFIEDKDIPIREDIEAKWNAWYKSNVISTSMESAALFVVSSIRRVRAGEVLATIGLTYADTPIVAKVGIEEGIKTAIEAIRLLAKQDAAR